MECSICLENMYYYYVTTNCEHYFHSNCLLTWQKRNNTCPLCRNIFKIKPNIIEYIIENQNILVVKFLFICVIFGFIIGNLIYFDIILNKELKTYYQNIVGSILFCLIIIPTPVLLLFSIIILLFE